MEFVELSRGEFKSFACSQPEESFMQSPELGDLRATEGFDVYYLGVKEEGRILCASLFCANRVFLGRKIFYAPRGYLIDWKNQALVAFFTSGLRRFVRSHSGFKIVLDPNHVYRVRGKDGSILENEPADEETFRLLKSLGYSHFGFNLYLEARQVRWAYRMELDQPYEEKKNQFSKSTRKNLEKAYSRGLRVRTGTAADLDIMERLFKDTATRKDFEYHETSYYTRMYRYMHDLMTIYIAHLDADAYAVCARENLRQEQENNQSITAEMQRDKVGRHLLHKKEISDQRILKLQQDLENALRFQQENPQGKDVAALLSMHNGSEYLTLTSGSLEDYRSFTPKYAMYDAHIRDAYRNGYKACNFYGISGNFQEAGNPFYGVYEFKRGFGGNVIEYIGEFELNVNFLGTAYDGLRRLRNHFRGRQKQDPEALS